MTCTLMPIQSSKRENVLFREALNQGRSNERISAFAPSVQPTLQRSDARHAVILLFHILGVHAERAGNRMRVSLEVHGMPQVNDNEIFSGVDLLLQFLCRDARDAQLSQESLSRDELICNVRSQDADNENAQAAAEMKRVLGNSFNLAAEDITQPYISTRPKKRAEHIEKKNLAGRM